MKPFPKSVDQAAKHQKIVEAARASFRIEGIQISAAQAQTTLDKIKLSLGKAAA